MKTDKSDNLEQEDRWWQAFLQRDPSFDGQFVVTVHTTGVYCRPTCFARPNRKNVEFFRTACEAEKKGYRPCKRCLPQNVSTSTEVLVARACEFIAASGHARLKEMGVALNSSPFHLQRVFKASVGVSPAQYARARRLEHMKAKLKDGSGVTEAAFDAGFNGSNRANDHINALGMTPDTYRRGGQGVVLDYVVVPTTLGLLLVAGTEKGLSVVFLGEDQSSLEQDLRAEYPTAQLEYATNARVGAWAETVKTYLEGHQTQTDLLKLPLDVQGTAFQARVWEALRSIPCGEKRSYADIAKAIGEPRATRAVARACGANRLALVIPCHRVVRSDGSLSGYRWGPDRKKTLLEQESAHGITNQERL